MPRAGAIFKLTFVRALYLEVGDGLEVGAGLTWVWTMTRMTLQYFFRAAKSFWICFLPWESRHLLQALVKAFFLLLCLSHTQSAQHPAR